MSRIAWIRTRSLHAYPDFHLLMPLYAVKQWRGEPQPREAQALAWVKPQELRRYAMPPADVPLVDKLIEGAAR